jgi:purine-binding chemotaxis protein CheW
MPEAMPKTAGRESARLVVFSLDELRYAVSLEAVESVVRIVEITPLPGAPEIVLGAVNLHGEIVPVMNPRRRFGLPERSIALSDQLIIARSRARRLALRVDAVAGVFDYPQDDIVAAAAIVPGTQHVAGVVKLADGMLLIHDLDRFLSLEEEQRLEQALADA